MKDSMGAYGFCSFENYVCYFIVNIYEYIEYNHDDKINDKQMPLSYARHIPCTWMYVYFIYVYMYIVEIEKNNECTYI